MALLGGLALLAACGVGRGPRAQGAGADPGWQEALTLVDWLGGVGPQAEVEPFIASAHRRESLFGASWRADLPPGAVDLARLEGAAVYAAELDLDPEQIGVRQALVWTNRGPGPVEQVRLRLATAEHLRGPLQVQANGQPARGSLKGEIVEVPLAEPLPPGERARLLLEYALQIPPFVDDDRYAAQINLLDAGTFGRSRGVFNVASALALATPFTAGGVQDERPVPAQGEHTWYEPAQFHVMLQIPAHYTVASTGVALDERTHGDRRTVRIVAAGAREFTVEAGPDLVALTEDVGGVRVRAFHSRSAPGVGERMLADSVGALKFFEGLWGPYPWAELDVVDAPVRVALGMEFPQIVTVDMHEDGAWVVDEGRSWTIAHEVAHQWWHALVGNDPWGEPWVDEALAAQASGLYLSEVLGEAYVKARWRDDMVEPYRQLDARGVGILPASLPAGRYDLHQYSLLIYGKAPLFLEAVRALLGDDRYHEALRRHRARHHLGFAAGTDLIEVFREVGSSPDLPGEPVGPQAVDALFRRWMVEVHPYEALLEREPGP